MSSVTKASFSLMVGNYDGIIEATFEIKGRLSRFAESVVKLYTRKSLFGQLQIPVDDAPPLVVEDVRPTRPKLAAD